jgi:hypothetical protein
MSETEYFPDGRELWMEGYIAARHIKGGEWIVVRQMIFSDRLAVMSEGDADIEHWCFKSLAAVFVAWVLYPNVPGGWTRHLRRDGTMEYPDDT